MTKEKNIIECKKRITDSLLALTIYEEDNEKKVRLIKVIDAFFNYLSYLDKK